MENSLEELLSGFMFTNEEIANIFREKIDRQLADFIRQRIAQDEDFRLFLKTHYKQVIYPNAYYGHPILVYPRKLERQQLTLIDKLRYYFGDFKLYLEKRNKNGNK